MAMIGLGVTVYLLKKRTNQKVEHSLQGAVPVAQTQLAPPNGLSVKTTGVVELCEESLGA